MSPKPRKMTSRELRVAIGRQINTATASVGDDITNERSTLFERYMGEPYGDEVEDRSQVVSTDISDTVEWIMPEIMEIFTGGDRVADFEPLGPDDEAKADQETDVVNHVFMRKNEGFLILYSFFKDALIMKNGYVKRWWDEAEDTEVEEYSGLSEDEIFVLQGNWAEEGAEVELEEAEQEEGGLRIKARVTRRREKLCIAPVPPEEIIFTPRWNKVTLDGCPFVAHRREVTVSELIKQGYDAEQVRSLPDSEDEQFSEERINRFDNRDAEEDQQAEAPDPSMREVMVYECYIYVDYDGDGVAELRRVTVGGEHNEILKWAEGGEDNEEVPWQPFSSITPIVVTHRHIGRSIAELVDDLQRIKTVLMRQMLDNVYLCNNPTREIAEEGIGETTIEDLLVERPGKIVRTASPGHYVEHTPPQFMQQMLPAIEYVDTVRENRTGVTRYNQGLDANSLNKTASGVNQIMNAAQKKLLLIARIFAETGVKHLFRGIHADLRRHATKRMTVKLRGNYVPVDPRHWKNREDMAVNVALGTGSREQMIARLMMIAEKQEQHILQGSPLVTVNELHHSYSQIIEKSGFKNPNAYFRDPQTIPPQPEQPPQPDPATQQVQLMAQIERDKNEQRHQLELAKLRLEDDRERDKLNIEAALKMLDINAKNGTAITIEQVRAAARATAPINQPGAPQ